MQPMKYRFKCTACQAITVMHDEWDPRDIQEYSIAPVLNCDCEDIGNTLTFECQRHIGENLWEILDLQAGRGRLQASPEDSPEWVELDPPPEAPPSRTVHLSEMQAALQNLMQRKPPAN